MGPSSEVSDYPTCQRCYATLHVVTGDAHPDCVTSHLNTQPTRIQVKGERESTFSNRISVRNSWSISSKGSVNSNDLRKHLDWLFERIASTSLK